MVRGEEPAAELTIDHLRALRVLGLAPGAAPDDIKDAWRDLAKVWHPDRFQHDERLQGKAGENLKRINEAYESLRDYDPGVRPRISARIRESVGVILGMGELGEPPPSAAAPAPPAVLTPTGPIGRRRSLRVLGLGVPRRTGEIEPLQHASRRAWLIAGLVIALAALLMTGIALIVIRHRPQ